MVRSTKMIVMVMSTIIISFLVTSSFSWDSCRAYDCHCYLDNKNICKVDRCGIFWEIPKTSCGKVCLDKCADRCRKRGPDRCQHHFERKQ